MVGGQAFEDVPAHDIAEPRDGEAPVGVEHDNAALLAVERDVVERRGEDGQGCEIVEQLRLAGTCSCACDLQDGQSLLRDIG